MDPTNLFIFRFFLAITFCIFLFLFGCNSTPVKNSDYPFKREINRQTVFFETSENEFSNVRHPRKHDIAHSEEWSQKGRTASVNPKYSGRSFTGERIHRQIQLNEIISEDMRRARQSPEQSAALTQQQQQAVLLRALLLAQAQKRAQEMQAKMAADKAAAEKHEDAATTPPPPPPPPPPQDSQDALRLALLQAMLQGEKKAQSQQQQQPVAASLSSPNANESPGKGSGGGGLPIGDLTSKLNGILESVTGGDLGMLNALISGSDGGSGDMLNMLIGSNGEGVGGLLGGFNLGSILGGADGNLVSGILSGLTGGNGGGFSKMAGSAINMFAGMFGVGSKKTEKKTSSTSTSGKPQEEQSSGGGGGGFMGVFLGGGRRKKNKQTQISNNNKRNVKESEMAATDTDINFLLEKTQNQDIDDSEFPLHRSKRSYENSEKDGRGRTFGLKSLLKLGGKHKINEKKKKDKDKVVKKDEDEAVAAEKKEEAKDESELETKDKAESENNSGEKETSETSTASSAAAVPKKNGLFGALKLGRRRRDVDEDESKQKKKKLLKKLKADGEKEKTVKKVSDKPATKKAKKTTAEILGASSISSEESMESVSSEKELFKVTSPPIVVPKKRFGLLGLLGR